MNLGGSCLGVFSVPARHFHGEVVGDGYEVMVFTSICHYLHAKRRPDTSHVVWGV